MSSTKKHKFEYSGKLEEYQLYKEKYGIQNMR